jgi:hypothetical protein
MVTTTRSYSDQAKDTFQFVGQANAGLVPDENCLLVLDTNVVSALHSVARRGFDLESASDRRVAHLLLWLSAHPSAAVFHAFGISEGAGFHRGNLDAHAVLMRAASSVGAIEHGRIHGEDWIRSGEPLPDARYPPSALNPDQITGVMEELLPMTVLPCYIAALAAALADRRDLHPLEAAASVFRRLADEIDYIPLFGWLTSALLFLGERDLRRELRQRLFKLQRPEIGRSCLSAAWDLGYLQLASVMRSPLLSQLFEHRVPVLVTEDRQLAPTAILTRCLANTPAFELEADQFDPRWAGEAMDLIQRMGAERLLGGSMPEWSSCTAAIASLEGELGIDGTRFSVWGETVIVKVTHEQGRAFVELLRFTSVQQILDSRETLDRTTDAALLTGVVILLADNARAHRRLVEQSVGEILGRSLAEEPRSRWLTAAFNMVNAALREDWKSVTAWARMLDIEDGSAYLWAILWSWGRTVLADTAEARGEPTEALIDRMLKKFDDAADRTEPVR